ncbi:MAG: hypothetical protein JW995_11480 [Melioribacteraceae bacterium]|nr:hypothetical protein [Melioribacteraceae bacterium]
MIYGEWFVMLCSLVGIIILINELRLKRMLIKEELNLKSKEVENDILERQEHAKWIESQSKRLLDTSKVIGENLARELTRDVKWASDALERAKIRPTGQSLFQERLGFQLIEKEYIADKFAKFLMSRCEFLINEEKKDVYIIIDSGTTLYPLFDRLGQNSVGFYETKDNWINHMTIVTNNLPGIEKLMDTGRTNPHNRLSPLAIRCELLPGEPLPVYSALTGEKTNNALRQLKSEAKPNAIFIGLVTGNWIRLRRSSPVCPVPLARGPGHLEFKQTILEISSEIYVVTPLGKIFANFSLEEVNEALGFTSSNSPNPDKEQYRELMIDDEKAKSVRLVSTFRMNGTPLYTLSKVLKELLYINDFNINKFCKSPVSDMPHLLIPFDKHPKDWFLQLETDFPQSNIDLEDFTEKYFCVPSNRD